ncbi:site-specific integrase [Peribacillus frigoritolerans]|uniref:site-specific integrase n=1 Tax=Peribacillus frigoritolerans TaxID=450367 RepID=UPI003D0953C7
MNFVQPIRDPEIIQDIERFLKEKQVRDYIMFILGIYTALRISDILRLRVKDLRGKQYLTIKEKKTMKGRTIALHPIVKRELKKYLTDKPDNEYVIKSRVGKNRPITRERAYAILREAAEEFGLDAIGTHTLRKTFGYHLYKKTMDVALLQSIFNHADPSYTLRYIGITQDSMNDAIIKLKYF